MSKKKHSYRERAKRPRGSRKGVEDGRGYGGYTSTVPIPRRQRRRRVVDEEGGGVG